MTEKKTALATSVIAIIAFSGFAYYVATLEPASKFGLSSSSSTLGQRSNNVAYGAGSTTITDRSASTLGASVEIKAGVISYFSNNQTEEGPTTLSNQ